MAKDGKVQAVVILAKRVVTIDLPNTSAKTPKTLKSNGTELEEDCITNDHGTKSCFQ